jgi:hypothetical protein
VERAQPAFPGAEIPSHQQEQGPEASGRVLADPGFAIAQLVGGDHLDEVLLVCVSDAASRPVVL